jgi:hypothetical protein
MDREEYGLAWFGLENWSARLDAPDLLVDLIAPNLTSLQFRLREFLLNIPSGLIQTSQADLLLFFFIFTSSHFEKETKDA